MNNQMKNQNLLVDLKWVSEQGSTEKQVMDNTVDYILFLEEREERLTNLENTLNTILGGDLPGKDAFIEKLKDFLNDAN